MRWLWRWLWRHTNGHDARAAKASAEAKLRQTQRAWPAVERAAEHIAQLSAEEYADRVAAALGRRRAQ